MSASAASKPDPSHGRERLFGILLVVVSALLFGAVDGIAKLLTVHASAAQIVWARYALALPVVLASAGPSGLLSLYSTTRPRMQLARAVTPLGVSLSMTFAVQVMPLAEATVMLFCAPLLTVALSAPLLGERVTASRWVAVVVGFLAVLLVAKPGFGEISHYAAFPLAAAVFSAFMQIATRHVARLGERPDTTLAWTLSVGTVLASPFAILFWHRLTLSDYALMIALGLIFGCAQLMMIRGYARAPAALLAPLGYMQIISATLLSFLLFAHVPDRLSLVGIALILLAGVYAVSHRGR